MTTAKPTLVSALIKFHQAVEPIRKESRAQYGLFANLHTVLATITPPLLKQGLVLTQTLEGTDLITTLRHTSGDAIESRCPIIEASGKNALHMWGAAVTYQRRYAIQALLCLAAEDDDGDSAGHKLKPATTTTSDDFL